MHSFFRFDLTTVALLGVVFVCLYPPSPTVLGTSIGRRFIWQFPPRPAAPEPEMIPATVIEAPPEVPSKLNESERDELMRLWRQEHASQVRDLPIEKVTELSGAWADALITVAKGKAAQDNAERNAFLAKHGPRLVIPARPKPVPEPSLFDKVTSQTPPIDAHALILEVLGILTAAAILTIANRPRPFEQ